MLGVARNATGGSTYHYPAGGELPAVSSRPTATGTHTSGVARKEDALRGGRGGPDPGVQVPVGLQKRGPG